MEDEKSTILHELYVFSEWKPEPDFIQKSDSLLRWNWNTLLKWIPFMGPEKSMLDNVSFYKDHHQRWQIALSDEGKVIAVLTDNILEIRTKRSDYSSIAARTTVVRDPNPQWRKIVWSPDCSFLVLSHSNGSVSFYDLTASNIFNIAADCTRPGGMVCTGTTHALSAIVFVPLRVKDNKWTWEVLLITHDGKLRGFLVSQTDGAKLHHVFQFPGGVSSAVFCGAHSLLLTAGLPTTIAKEKKSASDVGITAWRILNDDPFYKLSVASDQLDAQLASGIHYYMSFLSPNKVSLVVKMVISPDSTRLVCLHTDGDVSIWRLPLVKLIHRWRLLDQPEHRLSSPLLPAASTDNQHADEQMCAPADVSWWSNQEIILSRFSGAVTICGIDDMVNILGKNVEFLQGTPQVTGAYDNTFLALECETKVISASQLRNADSTEPPVDSEDEKGTTVAEATREMIKSVLYAITDIETFQPKPKKITVISRIYRLLGIKSTTPMDLFLRKIEAGNYEEALKLADSFHLDSDLVYQQQWRKTPVSCDAIYKYLAKVSKKIWVVHQCVDRLPETMTAAKDLLNFGLQLTNAEILEEVNRSKDGDRITSEEEIVLEHLNAHTSELLRCRHVMLFYSERLKLYESILKSEKSTYIRDEYHRLRSNGIVHSCIELAKEGRIAALSCLWLQVGSVGMQLTVLEHLPETINPEDYVHLLPMQPALTDKQLTDRVITQNRDWCRKDIFRSIWNSNWSEDATPEGESDYVELLTMEELSKWYEKRARQVEERSGLVGYALTLLTVAERQGVPNLDLTIFNLLTLDVLLYDVNIEQMTLREVERMTPKQICCNLMCKSTTETFLDDLRQYVIPYLKRTELFSRRKETCVGGLCKYLESISEADLSRVLLVLKCPGEFELDVRTHLELAERCLLAHQTTAQLDKACDVLGTILKESDGSISPSELLRRLNELEKLINACNTLSCHNMNMTLAELKEMQHDAKKIQMLLTKMARNVSIRNAPELPQQQDWEMLLNDIMELREMFFNCIQESVCYEIYASALLTSGNLSTIKLASGVMACEASQSCKQNNGTRLVPYHRAVELVLNAAEEYFNSASSLDDPSLELARACLNSINDDHCRIRAELDLISSLEILQHFGLSVLPIQVRLCEDRLTLIDECLTRDPKGYLASHKLLNLAKLLRVAGDDEHKREGVVLQRVAESGVRAGAGGAPGGAVAEAVRRLVALQHAPAAELLAHVAADPHTDRDLRRLLLNAALAHAPYTNIQDILRARLSLDLEDVQRELGEKLAALTERAPLSSQETVDSTDEDFADAVQTPIVENKGLFAPVVEENVTKISNLFVEQIWKNKLSFGWLEKETTQGVQQECKDKETCYAVHCPEFYASIYPDYVVTDAYYRYDRFSTPAVALGSEVAIAQSFMKWFYISDCLEKNTAMGLESQVMQKCGEESMYNDTALSVSCMLRACAGTVDPAHFAAMQRVHTAVCFALYALLVQYNEYGLRDQVFLTRPLQLARLMLGDTEPQHPRREITDEQIALIMMCLNKLLAVVECAKIKGFGIVVQADMFNDDADYRAGTIYRLASSLEAEHMEYACTLAAKYNINEIKVWTQHAASLVLKSASIPVSEVNARLSKQAMLQVLHSNREAAIQSIKEEIWEQIPGENHAALISYFTLIKNIDERALYATLSPTEHVKLLKKVKAASPELNYKLLLSQPSVEEFTQHLLQILRAENIGLVTKLLRTLPPGIKLPLSVNSIYTLWLTEHFFSVGSSATSKKWMQQYRQCASYFNKLTKEDLLTFIKSTCFTYKAIDRVPVGTRNLMIMQAVDYCQQEQENDFKSSSKIEPSWSETGQVLMRWARFLDNFYSLSVQNIIEKDDPNNKEIWIELESSRGEAGEARGRLAVLVLGGLKPQHISTLLQCLHVDISIDQLFTYILDHRTDDVTEMEALVSSLLSYDKAGVALSEELLQQAATRAAALHLQPHLHISLLSLSRKKQICEGGDMSRIAQFSLQLLKTEWGDTDIVQTLSVKDLQSEEGRKEVFESCLKEANDWQKKKTLVDVICSWPHFNTSSGSTSPYYVFVKWLLSEYDKQEENGVLLKLLLRRPLLSEEEIKLLAESETEVAIVNVLWIILLSQSDTLKEMIPSLLHKDKLSNATVNLSDELIKELLKNDLFTKLVSTAAYTPILHYIMNAEGESAEVEKVHTLEWAVKELTKANLLAEAGQLMLAHLGVPASLKGFSESVKCHKKLSNKHFHFK